MSLGLFWVASGWGRTPVAQPIPKHWSAQRDTPRGWYQAALCLHSREGAWNAATGNGYEGGGQFLLSTWTRVGGPVVRDRYGHVTHWASAFSPREQLYRMWLVWRQDGGSFREWGTAHACGLR